MKVDTDELLKKASRWSKIAPPFHAFYQGKVEVMPKCAIRSLQDFSSGTPPAYAQVCKDIEKDPELGVRGDQQVELPGGGLRWDQGPGPRRHRWSGRDAGDGG